MRVFLDTNVLVSAFVSRGLCADLLRTVLEKHELVVSSLVLRELRRVLEDKLGAPKLLVERALSVFEHVQIVPDRQAAPANLGFDDDDGTIAMSAVGAGAEIFVTGDREVLAAAGKVPLHLVSPRQFMELLLPPADRYPSPPEEGNGPKVSDRPPAVVEEAAFGFALKIIEFCRSLDTREDGWLVADLLREGTEIGAVLAGASAADTPRQILDAMSSALDLACKTDYRLRLLAESEVPAESGITPLLQNCRHLICLLQTITDPEAITYQARGGGR